MFSDFLIDINPDKVGKMTDKELKELMIKEFGNQVVAILDWQHDS